VKNRIITSVVAALAVVAIAACTAAATEAADVRVVNPFGTEKVFIQLGTNPFIPGAEDYYECTAVTGKTGVTLKCPLQLVTP
jgi:hypothetical protein